MELSVPTETVRAAGLRIGDIVVEMPRAEMLPWRGRRKVMGLIVGDRQAIVDMRFPSTLCRDSCVADPRTCPHYGQGGRADFRLPADEEEVIVTRS